MVEHNIQQRKKPRIISFDLEVSPALGYFYPPTWETRILETVHRQKLMSFAWNVVGETVKKKIDGEWVKVPKVHALNLSARKGYKKGDQDDKWLVTELHKVLSEADILLGQNSDQFDVIYFIVKS